MSRIKLIAFDLDGTLLNTDKKVTEYTKKVLKKAAEKGIEIVPATGRPLTAVPGELYHLPGVRYAITSNGARVIEAESKKTLQAELLPYEKAKVIMGIFREYDVMRDIFYDGQGYIEGGKMTQIERYVMTPAMIEYVRKERIAVDDIERMFVKERRDLDKVQAIFANPDERKEAWERLKALEGIEASGAFTNNIEVNAAGVHKGVALIYLGERLGIKLEEMLAFGDGSNDIKMLETAGTGVAMENAAEIVKEAADAIALSNDEDGVAQYIEKYVLS